MKSASSRLVGSPVAPADFPNLSTVKNTLESGSSNNNLRSKEDVEAQVNDPARKNENPTEVVSQELQRTTTIRFEENSSKGGPASDKALYVPPPHLRDRGHPLLEVKEEANDAASQHEQSNAPEPFKLPKLPSREHHRGRSFERVASSAFSIGPKPGLPSRSSTSRERPIPEGLPKLSVQATLGRNSQFHNLSAHDRELLGGVEYCALKLLLKVITGS